MEACLSSSSSLASSSCIATFVDEARKNSNTIFYTPSYLGRRWRSGTYMISARFFSGDQLTGDQNYLKACFLCKRVISENDEIFMYKGDAPFCSKDCRQEQIDMDKSLEKSRKFSNSASPVEKSSASTMKRKTSIIMHPSNHLKNDTAIAAG